MTKSRIGSRLLCSLRLLPLAAALVVTGALPAGAASKNVDLDKNGSNESIVDLTVISSYPAKIRNKITNKAVGKTYTFRWPSAGPGGFTSSLGAGTSGGVGTIWDWQTGQTIYSYTGSICDKDICLTPTNSSVGQRGPFGVPGRSLTPSDVTLSASSLTSSIISFFSPPQVLATATSEFVPGQGVLERITNSTGSPIVIELTGGGPCCEGSHQTFCDGECVSYLDDEFNCGACGIVCEGSKTCCNGECVDTGYDQRHCGACFQPSGNDLSCCAGKGVDIFSDPANCGGCGSACGEGEACNSGTCEGPYGVSAASNAADESKPSETELEGSLEKEGCPFGTIRCDGACIDPARDASNCGDCGVVCAEGEVCSAGRCFAEAPACDQATVTEEIPPGGTATICRASTAVIAREVFGLLRACGDSVPDGEEEFCANGEPASAGSFNRLEPVEGDVGPAFLTVHGVRVEDGTGDGLLSPGESARLWFSLLNVGSGPIAGVSARLVSDPVQLVDSDADGTPDGAPFGALLIDDRAAFPGFPALNRSPNPDCAPIALAPQVSTDPFEVALPQDHPGDVARPFLLRVSGTVGGGPWQQDVLVNLGVTGRCDPLADEGSYDGIAGLLPPMSRMVPEGDSPIFPPRPFKRGSVRPLKLYLSCNSVILKNGDVAPPEVIGLTRVGTGPL
ncbi:MAG: hypothetical protein MUE47_09895, partial [Acidobacteria bacterium]|nr:hypothetical protein [Acidobacteriota bacterium]